MTQPANGNSGANGLPHIGQQFKRVDQTGLVFEVVEEIITFGLAHFRVRRIDDPTDTRIFAHSALLDRHLFKPIQGTELPSPSATGQLRLSA
jgi:hypothetical protein